MRNLILLICGIVIMNISWGSENFFVFTFGMTFSTMSILRALGFKSFKKPAIAIGFVLLISILLVAINVL